jgi:hypothetical protein
MGLEALIEKGFQIFFTVVVSTQHFLKTQFSRYSQVLKRPQEKYPEVSLRLFLSAILDGSHFPAMRIYFQAALEYHLLSAI